MRAGKSGGRASSAARVGRELKEISRWVIDVKTRGVLVGPGSGCGRRMDDIWLWARMSFWR